MFFIRNLREENDYLRATRDRDRGIFFVLGLLAGMFVLFSGMKLKSTDGKELMKTVKKYGNDTMDRLSDSLEVLKNLVIRKTGEVKDELTDIVTEFEEVAEEELFEDETL